MGQTEWLSLGGGALERGNECTGDFRRHLEGRTGRDGPLLEQGQKVFAGDVLHDDDPRAAESDQAVDMHDRAVAEEPKKACLVPEAPDQFPVVLALGLEELERDVLLEPGFPVVPGEVDPAEAALPQEFDELVALGHGLRTTRRTRRWSARRSDRM